MLIIYVYLCVFSLTFFSLAGLVGIGYLASFLARRTHSWTRPVRESSVPRSIPIAFPEYALELD